jgi:hypothetical protein
MNTTNTARYSSYFGLHIEIDNESRLRSWVYDKRDDFNFHNVKYLFIWNVKHKYRSLYDIPELMVIIWVFWQGVASNKATKEPSRHHVRKHDLANRYGMSVSQMTTEMFHFHGHNHLLSSFIITGILT